MKRFLVFWLLSICGERCSCDDSNEEVEAQVALANDEFAIDLFNKLDQNENNFFSSLSITAAFTMLSLGAKGKTLDEIYEAFHLNQVQSKSSDSMAIHEVMKKILDEYEKQNANYSLSLASSLFAQENFDIKQKFLNEVKQYYEASVEKVDFGSGNAEGIINKWVEDKTNGKIKDFFSPGSLSGDTRLVLVNAIYFKGYWNSPFDEKLTTDEDFHLTNGNTKKVKMMNKSGRFSYYSDSALQSEIISLPYSGKDLSMIVILPNAGTDLSKVLLKITAERLSTIHSSMTNTKINLKLPKFKLETKYSLKDVLEKLGIKLLFTPQADLTGISDQQSLDVSRVVHKAYIEVNEKGTEAAAATGIQVVATSVIIERTVNFYVDRPAFFAIIDRRFNNEMLFSGTLLNP